MSEVEAMVANRDPGVCADVKVYVHPVVLTMHLSDSVLFHEQ